MYIDPDKEIRPQISFFSESVEDLARTLEDGIYRGNDVDYVKIKQAYAQDFVVMTVKSWMEQRKNEVITDRYPKEWYEKDLSDFKAWKQGQDLPVDGFPIKGWGVLSPSQQRTLQDMGVRTVEELSRMGDEGKRIYGIGAQHLVDRAQAWMKSVNDNGKVSIEIAALKRENDALKARLDGMVAPIEGKKRPGRKVKAIDNDVLELTHEPA
jgi:hypothetical protein